MCSRSSDKLVCCIILYALASALCYHQAAVAAVVDGLFSVCVTLGVVPIIRCPSGGSAEHVAGLLDQKVRGRRVRRVEKGFAFRPMCHCGRDDRGALLMRRVSRAYD